MQAMETVKPSAPPHGCRQPAGLAVLDRSRRHLHRRHRAVARTARCTCARCPRCASRRRGGDPGLDAARELMAAARRRRAPVDSRQGRHHGRHQRAAHPQRRAGAAGDHRRLRRCAAHRLPEPARYLRAPTSCCRQRLYARVIEARERIDARRRGADAARRRSAARAIWRARAPPARRAVAIVFLHGWRYPQHERAAAACARELGFEEVSVSHELSPLVRYVTRGDTTVLNAYLAPPLRALLSARCGAAARPRSAARADAHAEQRRTGGGGPLPRHGERAVGAGRRTDRDALGGRAARVDAPHRLRHGRHLHRRVADRRGAAAALRAPDRGVRLRAADARRAQHRRRRRLDPQLSATGASRWGRPLPAPTRGRPATGAAVR